MKSSRRGMISDLLEAKKSDADILCMLDKEFPAGHFKSSHKQALAGAKWGLAKNGAVVENKRNHTKPKQEQKTSPHISPCFVTRPRRLRYIGRLTQFVG